MIARLRAQRAPAAPDHPGVAGALVAEAGDDAAGRLAAPLRSVRREAGHPGHQRRRPDRRRRPDPGRPGPHPRRPGDHPLRPGARAPTGASSPSTSCPTWPSASRCRCSTCWRSATSRSAATSCGCRWTCCWWPAPTRRTTPTAGRIITPLKDRFGAEIRTHYPLDLDLEIDAGPAGGGAGRRRCPTTCSRCWPGSPAAVRESPAVDSRSGVSARFAIAAAETVAASALRRAGLLGEARGGGPDRRHRVGDQHAARQGRVRERRGGPRGRGPRPPAADRDGRDVPGPAGRAGPVRLRRPGRRGRDHRDRRAGRRRRDAAPGRHRARAWPRCSTGSAWATRPTPGRGGGRRRVRPRGAAPDPPAVQGPRPTDGRTLYGSRATMADDRNRYGAWRGGPDPLAPPYDVRAAVDEVGERGAGRRQPARGAAQPAAPRPGRPARPRRPARPGPAGCAGRRCAGATSTARSPGPSSCSTRRSRPSATSWPAATTTTPGSPRRCWTTCPARPPGRWRSCPTTTGPATRPAALYQQILDEAAPARCVEQRFAGMTRRALCRPGRPAGRRAEMMRDLNDAARPARPGRGHHRRVRRVHARGTASSSRRSPPTSTSWSTAGPAGRGRRAADALAVARSSARSWPS